MTPTGLPSSVDFGRSVFVCSKPMQALHCASIVRDLAIPDARLFVLTGGIDQSEEFREFWEDSPHGALFWSTDWVTDHRAAIAAVGGSDYDSLFIEDDRVSNYQLYAPLKRRYLSVFEEGVGTYVGPFVRPISGLRRLKWKSLSLVTGCGLEYGGGRETDFVFVQSPRAYRALRPRFASKARPFPGLLAELDENRAIWEQLARATLPPATEEADSACLILGTWGSTPSDFSAVGDVQDRKRYFKAHPHDGHTERIDGVHYVTSNWIPAELIVRELLRRHHDLMVVHHASSVEFNLGGSPPNCSFVDVAEPHIATLVDSVVETAGYRIH